MHGPPLEVADLVRSAGRNFIERNRSWLNRLHLKVLTAIDRCRTAALGGHLDQCVRCGHRAISFNSCRNRHCPKCQANARDRWLVARQRELLPTRYVHVVFTLPHELAPLALQNKRVIYDLLFRISAETLLEIARDPRHLGADIGFFSVLHSWNQKLEHHPHVHCVVPAGGLAPDHTHWVPSQRKFFLPGDVLAEVFRGKFREALEEAFAKGKLGFHGNMKPFAHPKVFAQLLRLTFRKKWVVYLKRPFGGPEHALRYLGCYTHRVAISNHRLVSFADDQVTFRWRDSKHGNKRRLMSLHVNEFLRRFLLHVLPPGFVRIRHFGFLSTRNRSKLLPVCFRLLETSSAEPVRETCRAEHQTHPSWLCPRCNGRMLLIERFTALQLRLRAPPDLVPTAA
jgi:Putative transposase/Transposase zinc-binding domain